MDVAGSPVSGETAARNLRSSETGLDRFLQEWALAFAREFAGPVREYPAISCGRARHLAAIDVTGVLWWRATIEGSRGFSVWVGAREKTWSAAGKLDWIRLLERSQNAAIEAVNPELVAPVRGGRAQFVQQAPDREHLCYAVMGIKLARTELPALLFALDPAVAEELVVREAGGENAPVPERLLDLELPLSVMLGRTKLPVGEVLKITSGSVIRLQGYTGSEVEILVHGTVVAKGQVVSHKGNYGVRIVEIISATDRAKLFSPK